MYKIAVLGDRESVMGFKALGLDVITAETVEEARRDLHAMAKDPDYAIIYLTEQFAAEMPDEVAKYKDQPHPRRHSHPRQGGLSGHRHEKHHLLRGACRGRGHPVTVPPRPGCGAFPANSGAPR